MMVSLKRRPKGKKNLYYSEKAGLRTILVYLVIILVIILVIYFLYNFSYSVYDNIPKKPSYGNVSISTLPELKNSSYGEVKQFYPNMKFDHNNISYYVDISCSSERQNNVDVALNLISEKVNKLSFYPGDANYADIQIVCSDSEKFKPSENSKFFVAGEGGAREIIETGRYNIISSGVIYLYSNPQNAINCNWPTTELHELMHVFGFNHSMDSKSLMYPYLESCDQSLDDSVIFELNRLYSMPNLADLYFQNISAVRKGRYLDFNFTIKNSGDVNLNNLSFSVIEDGQLVETKYLGKLNFGAGIAMEVTNLKLFKSDSKEIKIILDYYNQISEIDKSNNVAILKFG